MGQPSPRAASRTTDTVPFARSLRERWGGAREFALALAFVVCAGKGDWRRVRARHGDGAGGGVSRRVGRERVRRHVPRASALATRTAAGTFSKSRPRVHGCNHGDDGGGVCAADFERASAHCARGQGERVHRRGANVAIGHSDSPAWRIVALVSEHVLVK